MVLSIFYIVYNISKQVEIGTCLKWINIHNTGYSHQCGAGPMLLMSIKLANHFMLTQTWLNWDVDWHKQPKVHDLNQMPLLIS